METNFCFFIVYIKLINVGNPLLSERDGNNVPVNPSMESLSFLSETHYSLKEMETFYVPTHGDVDTA